MFSMNHNNYERLTLHAIAITRVMYTGFPMRDESVMSCFWEDVDILLAEYREQIYLGVFTPPEEYLVDTYQESISSVDSERGTYDPFGLYY